MSDIERLTPEWLLELVREVGNGEIGLDPCTTLDNPTRAVRYCTPDGFFAAYVRLSADDGLTVSWLSRGLVFANEPYSRATSMPWSRKIVEEAERGVEIIRLTRASTDTAWWHLSVPVAQSVCFLKGRPKFAKPGQEVHGPGEFASAVVYYGDRARVFERVFGPYGWCVRP